MSTANTPPRLGEVWAEQGGIYVGMIRGFRGAPDQHLILSDSVLAYAEGLEWGSAGEDEPGAANKHDGLTNTVALVQSKHNHPAAEWAAGLEIGAFSDFYLPSQCELALCFVNGGDHFKPGWYWSSTQYSRGNAWGQYFVDGIQYYDFKSYEGRARAVRRLIP